MSFQVKSKSLFLRAVTKKDDEFLYKLYCTTRTEEMKQLMEWTEMQKELFLKMQFEAQHSYYQQHYQGGLFFIIENNGKPVGRFYMHENYESKGIRLVELTVLPAWRRKGIGSKILSQAVEYATEKGKGVTLQVQLSNRAIKLYEKLGFVKVSSSATHHLMEWQNH